MGIEFKNARTCLLAAGNGKRAGGPKARRDFHGKPLLSHQLDFLLSLFEPEFISISIQEIWMEDCMKLNNRVRWVPVNPEDPPMAALITTIHEPGPWAFVYHVDMPVWEKNLWTRLAEEISDEFDAIMPRCREKGGHPVLLSPEAQKNILKLDPQKDRLDFWLHGQKVKMVDVPFESIHENWNQSATI